MKNNFIIILVPLLSLAFSSCCWMDYGSLGGEEEICEDQLFEETNHIKVKNTYSVNKAGPFIEAATLTAADIQNALKIEGNNFEIVRIELTSASISYLRHNDNVSGALTVSVAVVGNTFNQLLLQKSNVVLPLYNIPGLIFTEPVNINEYLNGPAITELKKILLDYATILNDDGMSFLLIGEGTPSNTLAHFDLVFTLNLSIVYRVCRFVPIGTGMGPC